MSNTLKLTIGGIALTLVLMLVFVISREGQRAPSDASVSDTTVSEDLTAIDEELKRLEEDRAAIDQGLSEYSVE